MRGLPESVGKHNFCPAIRSTWESVVQAVLQPHRFRLPKSNFWLITDSLLLSLNILFVVAAKWRSIRKWTYCFTLFMRASYCSCWMLWMDADLTLGNTHSAFSSKKPCSLESQRLWFISAISRLKSGEFIFLMVRCQFLTAWWCLHYGPAQTMTQHLQEVASTNAHLDSVMTHHRLDRLPKGLRFVQG